MGSASRRKGARGELEVVRAFHDAGLTARRVAPLQASNSRATPVPDVAVGLEVGGIRLWPEVKRGKLVNIRRAVAQAAADCEVAGDGYIPMAVHRDDGRPWLVTLELEYFLELLNAALSEDIREVTP